MEQLEFFKVPSPCIGVCAVDERGYCKGCMRKREERFHWLEYSPAQQLRIIKLCKQRYRRKMLRDKAKNVSQTEQASPQRDLFTDI